MFTSMRTSRVESELVEMAGHLAAGTCRFLQLPAEFDERDGWAGPGLRTCAQWLNWRVGLSLRTARDHLRVAHALRRLPLITAAFAAGRVSYSKVRAMTRIATPATEEGLLRVALHGTTSQLEGLVQAARAVVDPRPARARRGLYTSRAADGSLLVRLRIPAEQGEELMSAIEAYVAEQVEERNGSGEPSDPERSPGDVVDPGAAQRLDALVDLVVGARVERPATLVVHVRADEPDEPDDRSAAWIEGGPAVPVSVAGRLACAASVQAMLVDRRGNPLFLGRERRIVTRRQLRALRVRDRGRCVSPGCTSTRRLQAHHVRWWRLGGVTDLDDLALVCGFHHVLIHDHGYRMDAVDGGFVFGRPDGTPVPVAGSPASGDVGSLVAPGVDDRTITPRWGGERLDRDHFLTWLLPARRREEQRAAA